MEFNRTNIMAVVGETHFVQNSASKTGNLKVDLKRLVDRQSMGMTDDEKVDLLVTARDKLRAEGFNATISLQTRRQDNSYSSWPHLWVNQTEASPVKLQEAQDATAARLAKLEAMVQKQFGVSLDEVAAQDSEETVTETTEEVF